MKINIRKLNYEDYHEYINLINQFRSINCEISNEKFIEIYDIIFKSNIIFVAEYNNKLLGSITLNIEQKFIHQLSKYIRIEDLIVHRDYRHNSIGSDLIKHVINYSKEINAYKITLTCNENLVNFYIKNNFEIYNIHMSQLLN
tara:strand:- start:6752 stop:7180 length:429 start_codon:yes stop_codon:yes gene_type:complete